MSSTKRKLDEASRNLAESLGAREHVAAATRLSPVVSPRDIGRRPMRNVGHVDVERIIADPSQPRRSFDEEALERLAESIRDKGQMAPVHVRWSEDDGKWVIISGERRFRAAKIAGCTSVECYFQADGLSESELLERQLIENLLREDLKPIEEARGFKALMELNQWNGKQVAQALRINESRVSRSLALLRLPETIQMKVEEGAIASRSAYELSRIKDPELRDDMAKSAELGDLSHERAAAIVRQQRGKRGRRANRHRLTFQSESGWSVVVTGRGCTTYHHVEQALRDALAEVEVRIRNGVRIG